MATKVAEMSRGARLSCTPCTKKQFSSAFPWGGGKKSFSNIGEQSALEVSFHVHRTVRLECSPRGTNFDEKV